MPIFTLHHRLKIAVIATVALLCSQLLPLGFLGSTAGSSFSLTLCLPNGELQEISIVSLDDPPQPHSVLGDGQHCPFCRTYYESDSALLPSHFLWQPLSLEVSILLSFFRDIPPSHVRWESLQARAPPILILS